MPKVFLSPSTQEFNRAIDGNSEEYYANLITDAMISYLNASGIEYGRNSRDMTALESAQTANRNGYDFYLAIHSNASNGEQRSGAEIYYFPGSIQGRRAANIFANNYRQIYPMPQNVRIIPLGTLIELNKTSMPAILFEVAYHDNFTDLSWMKRNIPEIGRNLAISVADYFGVPFIEPFPYATGTVSVSSGNLNIRSEPNFNSQVIGRLQNGDRVQIIERVNNWFRIRSGNLTGYVNSRYIDT